MSQHAHHLRSARALLLAAAVAGALLGILFASQHASAYGTNYCVGWEPSTGSCVGPEHTLTANIVYDDTGSGSFVCDIAYSAHTRRQTSRTLPGVTTRLFGM